MVLIKILLNLNNYIKVKYYLKKYEIYLKEGDWKFLEFKPKIVDLFERAGVTDSLIPVAEPVGYGHIITATISLFGSINNASADVVLRTRGAFHESIGVYRSRIFESISPIYWVSLVVYLPKKSLKYIGVKKNNIFINTIQVFYWIAITIIALLNVQGLKFISDIKNCINKL